ncbi:MAG TPA: hypothetical protein VM262_16075 [Acidimicrobiales bacterium]|nr:hypothetical protein [Acidimicrobiales bacterium]
MTRRRLPLALAVLASLLAACGGPDDTAEERLRDALNRTERLARTFVYVEEAGGTTSEVVGLVEDDFRSKARLSIDGSPVFDQVQSDDVLAVRFVDPDLLPAMIEDRAAASDEDGVDPVEALRSRRWVLDLTGAPPLSATDAIERSLGDDQILDALDAFRYVRGAIGGARRVIKFNPDSLDYKPSEDPFPHPEDGVIRYDLERPSLPRASAFGGTNTAPPLPGIIHLRKMSVYVEDGLVIRVLEQIDPAERLSDIIDGAVNYLRDVNASNDAVARVRALKQAPADQASEAVIAGVNLFRERQGEDPIRLRTLRLEFPRLGGVISVELPGDFVAAGLEVLKHRGADVAALEESDDDVAAADR